MSTQSKRRDVLIPLKSGACDFKRKFSKSRIRVVIQESRPFVLLCDRAFYYGEIQESPRKKFDGVKSGVLLSFFMLS